MNKAERCHAAMDYRRQGLNCSQCLLAAFRDRAGLTVDQAMALGAGMGGGVRCGSICGAVSAPVMLLGTACPDPTDRAAVTARVKEYQRRFTERSTGWTAGSCCGPRSWSRRSWRWSWPAATTAAA